MSEFLFELRFLELPPWRARRLIESFGRRLFEELTSRGLVPGAMVSGGSVRRLTFRFSDLPEQEPERTEERIGPAVADAWDDDGEPTEALRAFAAEHEVDPSAVERLHTLRGDHAGLLHARPGRRLREVLIDLLPALAAEVVGAGDRVAFGVSQWPRPLNGVLAALDGELLPIVLDSCAAELASAGHWIHSPDTFPVADADSWSRELAARGLITGWAARRQAIQSALQQAAEPFGTLRDDADLLEDSTARCEQPFVVVGRFEPSFLELPAELVAAALAGRHGAFAVVGADGDLAPVFLAVVDWPGSVPDTVVGGLERSARGHLEDLRFHVESDRTQALAERLRRLEDLVFHPLLGSSADQARRREALAREVCAELDWQEEVEAAAEAALLLDVDRTTAVVEQFPSLRGVVGGLYARAEGYGESIWQAMYDSAGSVAAASPPRGRAGRAVAVADRLVGLVGLIGVGQASAGTRTPMSPPRRREIGPGPAPKAGAPDPAGLADDLLGLLLETGMEVDLDLLAARSVLLYGDRLERPADELLRELQATLDARLVRLLGRRGFVFDEIEAARAVDSARLVDLLGRLQALRDARGTPALRALAAVARRIAATLDGAESHGGRAAETGLSEEALTAPADGLHPAEAGLADDLARLEPEVADAAEARDFARCLQSLGELPPSIDRLLSEVLVLDDDAARRAARLDLLERVRRLFRHVARFEDLRPVDAVQSAT